MLQTTKKTDKENHELGLENIKDSVERLHGKFDIEYDDRYFSVKIMLPNYTAKAKKEAEN